MQQSKGCTTRSEWRFWFPSASEDMAGTQWRSECPSAEEIQEWREDLPSCWLERREIVESPPVRLPW